ncbi:hypothetical protein GMB50_12550 [Turicibacter sanguinis]|uniref:hypothetical protein n=1 Tax=Turicibacter sanguinis TaxID=154288 RepID=UPI0012BD5C46|nr:hypothetical protein [Turicibacter sanguinis]MDB8545638.1 hypothetical protein [Turicibacter sanguinis]MTO10810.1 hypothetical protein [Turicibacter sanguinis]MTP48345.1 hypothetical protein [Turicibacter sanguinis]MTP51064.1 hypothetical protein [Turicibacter sanguinis]MTQ08346.1 hypothetical protein [Turicibacter sanguinis]
MKVNLKFKNEVLIYTLLFLFSIHFINKGSYLLIFTMLVVLFRKGLSFKVNFNINFIFLLLFSSTYIISYSLHFGLSLKAVLYFFIGPIISFLLGYDLIKSTNLTLSKLVIILSLGTFTHGLLNMLLTFLNYGLNNNQRIVIDIWRKELVSATGQGMFFTLISSIFIIITIFSNYSYFIKTLFIFMGIFSIYSTLQLANRTLLVIIMLVWGIVCLIYFYLKKFNLKLILKWGIFISSSILVCLILYENNILNMKEIILSSPLFNRIQSGNAFLDTSRTDIVLDFFDQWFNYPLGGNKIVMLEKFLWTHNLWLDIYCAVGAIPFSLFVFYSLFSIRDVYIFIKRKNNSIYLKLLIVAIYIGMLANFMVEPILENNPYFFMIFIIVNGALKSVLINNKGELS